MLNFADILKDRVIVEHFRCAKMMVYDCIVTFINFNPLREVAHCQSINSLFKAKQVLTDYLP